MATIQEDKIADAEVAAAGQIDMKLEVVVLPVSDADRAADFYARLGWRVDVDVRLPDGGRILQFTPPGSPASILVGTGLSPAAPGSAQYLHLVVSDIEAAERDLAARGVETSGVFHDSTGGFNPFDPRNPGERPRSGAAQLRLVRDLRRSGRQSLAAAGDHRALAGPGLLRDDELCVRAGPRGGDAARGGGAWRARAADGRGPRRELAGLVRRLHGGRAGRKAAAAMTKNLPILLAALTAIAAAPASSGQGSGAPPGVTRTELQRHDLSTPGREAIQVRVALAPGMTFPDHSHPGEEIIYVLEGTFEYRVEGRPVTVGAGEVLFVPAGAVHSARNAGSGDAVELATYIVEKGRPLLVLAR